MSKQNLSKPYHVRLPTETAAKFEQLAIDSGIQISAVLRRCLSEAQPIFKQRKQIPVAVEKDRLTALRYMYKTSNNINQVAKHLNTLSLKGELSYETTIHYFRILDTIEAQLNLILEIFNAHQS